MTIRITVEFDHDCESPMSWDSQWSLHSFLTRHANRIELDAIHDEESGELREDVREDLKQGLAFFLDYYEHGIGEWSFAGEGMQCQWDTSRSAGILRWEHSPDEIGAKTYDDREKDAQAFLSKYNDWAQGCCFGYVIERINHCSECGQEHESEEIDSCWGFIGEHSITEEIKSILRDYIDEDIEIEGEAKDYISVVLED